MATESVRYERLGSIEKQRPTYDVDSNVAGTPGSVQLIWTRKQAIVAFSTNIVILAISLCILLIAVGKRPLLSDLECAKKVSAYSPAWDAVQFWEGTFSNSFNLSSLYRGPPTLKREQAWHELWFYKVLPVDETSLEAINQTQRGRHVEVLGSDPMNPKYGAFLEVFHQLHCLNLLRQHSWGLDKFNKSWPKLLYPSFLEDRVTTRMHVDHCIETLRLSLMCSADITPLLYVYDEDRALGFGGDFNTYHKCRDFNKIVDYVKENGLQLHIRGEQEDR